MYQVGRTSGSAGGRRKGAIWLTQEVAEKGAIWLTQEVAEKVLFG
jgi:hypothetical protein